MTSGTRPNPAIRTGALTYTTSCVSPAGATSLGGLTEAATFQHEVGHGYGYDHFDGWISGINTFQTDVVSCELGTTVNGSQFITPDALLTQCHDLTYGIGAGRDISITPVVQPTGCTLSAGACALIPGSLTPVIFASSTTTTTRVFRFTTLMNRGGIGAEGVNVGIYVSSDRIWSPGDVQFHQYFSQIDWQPGSTIPQTRTVTFNPQVAMPTPGINYFALVVVDFDQYFSETRESNNVTDLAAVFRRNP